MALATSSWAKAWDGSFPFTRQLKQTAKDMGASINIQVASYLQ
jgi:hypothetical protein